MKLLEDKIRECGEILPGDVLKVDSFLNHQIDVKFAALLADEFYEKFKDSGITKILTIEASGISVACFTAMRFGCNVVYAKKNKSSNLGDDVFTAKAYSYTHGVTNNIVVSKKYLSCEDRLLIIDDFLALGSAAKGLIDICGQAGAEICGIGMVVEKAYQSGGKELRDMGYRVESLARVAKMTDEGGIEFAD